MNNQAVRSMQLHRIYTDMCVSVAGQLAALTAEQLTASAAKCLHVGTRILTVAV
jgi:hypothetical protein